MKRLLHVALAMSLLGSTAALSQPYQQGRQQDQRQGRNDRGPGDHGYSDHGPGDHGYSDHGPGDHGPGDHGRADRGHGEYGREDHGSRQYGSPPREAMRHHGDWHRGDRFEGHRYELDWRRHHLRPPPRGYVWVNAGGQYLMIAIASGVIADVLLNAR
ncbi:MAG: RcnB family protein [Rhodospirillales bacterium]|nr:RcnB family protein [Rhodospirillales bacterium]